MRDRELFQRAVRALPVLALPLLASRVAGSLVKDSIPKMVGMILSLKAGDPLGQGGVLFLVLLLSLTGMLAAVLLSLGASLLALAVQTAYLRSPEGGFWRAVRFGLGEGLRKWPKTIGAQLKFVVPVHLGLGISTILLRKLAVQAEIPGLSLLYDRVGQGLNLAGFIWILTLYGQLAANRYDHPEKKEEVETL